MDDRITPSTECGGLSSLAGFVAGMKLADLPVEVVCQARACLLYGLMVGVASTRANAPRIAAKAMDAEYDGTPEIAQATRLLDGKRTLAGQAAFANAALMHARVQEDAHPTGHVGVVVVPAALAVAERLRASGPALLAALIAGYEVALRIGRDHAADTSNRGFRTTPLYGVIGAAAAAARLMNLTPGQTQNALALAANNACGLREFVNAGTEEYVMHAGFAARNGITAAVCASAGAQAAPTTLEGPAGFLSSYGSPDKRYDSRLCDQLGEHFEFLRVTYKPYPTCQFHRSVVRGVLALRQRVGDQELEHMRIRMNPFEANFIGVRYAGPYRTFAQTFMSAPFCAALAWARRAVTHEGMHAFDDAAIGAHVARIEVIADADVPRYEPRIDIQCAGGVAETWDETPDPDGYALTWDAAVDMAGALGREAGIAENAIAALVDVVDRLNDADSTVDSLIDTLRAMISNTA